LYSIKISKNGYILHKNTHISKLQITSTKTQNFKIIILLTNISSL